ncbi:cotranscriptional regulator ARB2A isoform X5 [Opisthocomus hoazin]|uniref:cotranscriptional regulator ARB2A isoform X5 n=1 Tax=Opisthocomus hoazin TaxID=30419 RepID=UPI003F536208
MEQLILEIVLRRSMYIYLGILNLLTVCVMMAQLQQGGPDEKEKTTALKDLLSRIDLDELMKKDEPPLEFPDTLEGFEYLFNEKGQLRHIKTGEPFVFNYREDLHRWNQKRYEALGEIITKYVYELLQKECHLKKVTLPVDAAESEPKSFIFMSEDALTNPDKLLVLIHGNGVVRAGQWARRLIINEDLDSGTQIPYIKRAVEEGYGVIVLNPNENYIEVEKTKAQVQLSSDSSDEPAEKRERKEKIQKETKKRRDFYEKYRNPQKEKETMQIYIRDNGSPEEHAIYVWDHFISQSAAENVFFVAHSYGGLAFVELNCCNWVSSSEALDTSVESMLPDCPRVSAGTERHELTSWKSFPSIFKFFSEAVEAKNSSVKPTPTRRSNRIKYEDL